MAAAHRRREVSRIEGFSDAVFAFAITLLVVSLEVPKTYDELIAVLRGFPAFAVCFALLFQVWWRHYTFFRSYDLEDGATIALTGVLLFVVLFYVYPLKFMWSLSLSQLRVLMPEQVIRTDQVPALFAIYGAGVMATFGLLAALYGHAYRLRASLGLTPVEVLDARAAVYGNLGIAAVALVSVVLALILGRTAPHLVGLAGYVYFAIGLVGWRLGKYRGRERRRLQASTTSTSTA